MASCDHLEENPQDLSYYLIAEQESKDNRNCFTQTVFPTASCYDSQETYIYKFFVCSSNSSPNNKVMVENFLETKLKLVIYLTILAIFSLRSIIVSLSSSRTPLSIIISAFFLISLLISLTFLIFKSQAKIT